MASGFVGVADNSTAKSDELLIRQRSFGPVNLLEHDLSVVDRVSTLTADRQNVIQGGGVRREFVSRQGTAVLLPFEE